VPAPGVGGLAPRRQLAAARALRLLPPAVGGLVRHLLGAHGLRRRRHHRPLRLRHGRLRLGRRHLRRPRAGAAGLARRDHARAARQRQARLLRRQPRRRLQRARAHRALRRRRRGLPPRRVRRRRERHVPRGPPRHGGRRRRRRGGVQERVLRVRQPAVLLHRAVRLAGHVRAHQLLAGVQERLPVGVQLRVRRRQQHLHLHRRLQLRHHLLPCHLIHDRCVKQMEDNDSCIGSVVRYTVLINRY
jgi:hypothetical protein